MYTIRQCAKSAGIILLIVGFTMVMSGAINVYGYPGLGPNIPAQDFILTASKTLIKTQPGMSGSLVIWANLYCPNSTSSFVSQGPSPPSFGCDTTILPIVTLQILGGCPGGAYCVLDRTQILVLPVGPIASESATNFFVYSFSFNAGNNNPGGSVSTVTVLGTDQFGHSHTVQFGVALCYC